VVIEVAYASTKMQNQIAKSREQTLAAFVSKKAEIGAMLTRLQALSDHHFSYSPGDITWDHVATIGYYAEVLKRVTDSAFVPGGALLQVGDPRTQVASRTGLRPAMR
jgi:hypothetical protein